jgi:hypothetical protein
LFIEIKIDFIKAILKNIRKLKSLGIPKPGKFQVPEGDRSILKFQIINQVA